ncbi:hypothetical protein PX554_14025 [Sphingomonas sp. H39-1-10]|nr:hypothetical protein [Sphingomonas pollutisoli]MDF0489254.1 hypothetical protein [Sphingomonas pollutisoli]
MEKLDLTLTPSPFFSPCGRHSVMHVGGDPAIEMIDVELIEPFLKTIGF